MTQVLRKVTGTLNTGELIVLMGGSGSGKTTLLNAIAGRGANTEVIYSLPLLFSLPISTCPSIFLIQFIQISGELLVNGIEMREELQLLTGYVLQNDYLHPCLTVRECLKISFLLPLYFPISLRTMHYIAMLRLPASMSNAEKIVRVEEIIHELGLKDCANTLIGDEFVRGISGGEKRRVSIAAQMLTDPSMSFCLLLFICLLTYTVILGVLLLDEPTSGLDAFTAHNIIDTLKRIARRGRLILCFRLALFI